jgi:hypothetical protein
MFFKNIYKTIFKVYDAVTLAQRCEFEQGPMRPKKETGRQQMMEMSHDNS